MKNFRLWYQNKRGRGIIVIAAINAGEAINSLNRGGSVVSHYEQIPDYCSVSYTVPGQVPAKPIELTPATDPRQLSLFAEVSQ